MKKKTIKFLKTIIIILVLAAMLVQPVFASGEYTSREEVPDEYKWDLTHIYQSQADWEKDALLLTDELLPRVAGYRGRLDGKESILACLRALTEANIVIERLLAYATLNLHTDMGNPGAQRLYGMSSFLYSESMEISAYIIPELSRIDAAILEGYLADPDFAPYRKLIDDTIKKMPHILSDEETELLARATLLTHSPGEIYAMLDTEGDEDVYINFQSTFAAILAAEVNKNIFLARSRNYNSALEASLSPDIPVSVYDNLIDSVSGGLTAFHRFVELRGEINRLDAALEQALNQPLYAQRQTETSYEDAKNIILEALAPLGEEYGRTLRTAFENNWIDAFPTPGKLSGAYSMSLYDPHPYVLMDYEGTFFCVSSLAHEMGHAVHQYYSREQAFHDYQVTAFTTEVASTVNEILLHRYMIDNAETDIEKLFYMHELANTYANTFFHQVLLAEFEKLIHESAEAGNPLNIESIAGIWLELTRKYYGPSFEINERTATRWAVIPHFYGNSFYVYKYATSIAAASGLASRLMEKEPGTLESYLEFLRSGSRDDPVATLAKVGLDMTSPRVIEEFLDEFAALANDIETLFEAEKARRPIPQTADEEEAPPQTADEEEAPPQAEPAPPQEPESSKNEFEYIVKRGDTLSKIAAMFNTTWQELQRINNIKDPNMIYPGQVIRLPDRGNLK